jgi:hypothetical protein
VAIVHLKTRLGNPELAILRRYANATPAIYDAVDHTQPGGRGQLCASGQWQERPAAGRPEMRPPGTAGVTSCVAPGSQVLWPQVSRVARTSWAYRQPWHPLTTALSGQAGLPTRRAPRPTTVSKPLANAEAVPRAPHRDIAATPAEAAASQRFSATPPVHLPSAAAARFPQGTDARKLLDAYCVARVDC